MLVAMSRVFAEFVCTEFDIITNFYSIPPLLKKLVLCPRRVMKPTPECFGIDGGCTVARVPV